MICSVKANQAFGGHDDEEKEKIKERQHSCKSGRTGMYIDRRGQSTGILACVCMYVCLFLSDCTGWF